MVARSGRSWRATATAVVLLVAAACTPSAETVSTGVGVEELVDAPVAEPTAQPAIVASQPTVVPTADVESGAASEPTPPPTPTPTPTSAESVASDDETGVDHDASTYLEIWALAASAEGPQLRLDRVVLEKDRTLVHGRVHNTGNREETWFFHDTATHLIDDQGERHELLEFSIVVSDVAPGDFGSFIAAFSPLPADASSFGLEMGSSTISVGDPVFSIPPTIELANPGRAPALPPIRVLGEVDAHPSGLSMIAHGMGFTDETIVLEASLVNGSTSQRAVGTFIDSVWLEDDLGNRYPLRASDGSRSNKIELNASQRATGRMVFGGRIAPDASTLRFVSNDEGSATDRNQITPRLDLGPWSVATPSTPAPLPAAVLVNESFGHANGSEIDLEAIRFEADGIWLDLTVTGAAERSITLNGCCLGSYLEDDLGNRLYVQAAPDNAYVSIDRQEQRSAALAVPGRVDPRASSVRLVLNDQGEIDQFDASTREPRFDAGPWPLDWSGPALTTTLLPDELDGWSEMIVSFVERSALD